jgi:hypothetical protein
MRDVHPELPVIFGGVWPHRHRPSRILLVGSPVSAVPAGVTVADIQPEHAVILEDPLHPREDLHKAIDELPKGFLQTYLPIDVVVPEAPLGRRGHHALNRLVGDLVKSVEDIAFKDGRVLQPNLGRRSDPLLLHFVPLPVDFEPLELLSLM